MRSVNNDWTKWPLFSTDRSLRSMRWLSRLHLTSTQFSFRKSNKHSKFLPFTDARTTRTVRLIAELTRSGDHSQKRLNLRRQCFFVPRDLDLWPFDPKISCIKTDTQINGGKNPAPRLPLVWTNTACMHIVQTLFRTYITHIFIHRKRTVACKIYI